MDTEKTKTNAKELCDWIDSYNAARAETWDYTDFQLKLRFLCGTNKDPSDMLNITLDEMKKWWLPKKEELDLKVQTFYANPGFTIFNIPFLIGSEGYQIQQENAINKVLEQENIQYSFGTNAMEDNFLMLAKINKKENIFGYTVYHLGKENERTLSIMPAMAHPDGRVYLRDEVRLAQIWYEYACLKQNKIKDDALVKFYSEFYKDDDNPEMMVQRINEELKEPVIAHELSHGEVFKIYHDLEIINENGLQGPAVTCMLALAELFPDMYSSETVKGKFKNVIEHENKQALLDFSRFYRPGIQTHTTMQVYIKLSEEFKEVYNDTADFNDWDRLEEFRARKERMCREKIAIIKDITSQNIGGYEKSRKICESAFKELFA